MSDQPISARAERNIEAVDEAMASAEAEFSPEVQEIIKAGLEVHRKLPAAQAEVEKLLALRRARVLRARAAGVSGYRLAKIFEVSQTSIGNWSQDHE